MMHLTTAPPQPVAIVSHFDYMAADARRRRIYAAHTGSEALVVVNADSGQVLGQVDIGPLHGIAVDESSGIVYTGDESGTISAVDTKGMQVVNSIAVGRPVDAIAYDPVRKRIYADEDSGNHVFVVDATKMKLVATLMTPGTDHEYLAVDPKTGDVYQNIPDLDEFVVIDPASLKIVKAVKTPELKKNHPLQVDAVNSSVIVGGKNGVLSIYSFQGKLLGSGAMPPGVDQCDLDQAAGLLACAAEGTVSVISIPARGAPKVLAKLAVGNDAHTVAIDPRTHDVWTALVTPHGDYIQRIYVKQ
jgi:DNA-binding beta-propeller fold protein YncE